MSFSDFLKSGHKPTLLSAFLYSDMSFMVWILLGPLAVHIGYELNLTVAQQYTLVAIPLLVGAILRLPVGALVDYYGPKRIGIILQCVVIFCLFFAYQSDVSSVTGLYLIGVGLGLAGTSMAVALPLSSHWYPDQYQGLALGVAGAASSGTVFAVLLAPVLADAYGWRSVLGFALIPLLVTLAVFWFYAKEAPRSSKPPRLSGYFDTMKDPDAWWFMFFYAIAFGGVLSLSTVLVLFFHQQYHFQPSTAGYFAAMCVLASALLRPFGGWLADHWGGIRSMQVLFGVSAMSLLLIGLAPGSGVIALFLLFVTLGALGMSSGAIFQLVPLRFRHEIGVVTGLIGAAGGLGGFFLAEVIGKSKDKTDSFQMGFLLFAALTVLCLFGIRRVKSRWRTTWGSGAMTSARV